VHTKSRQYSPNVQPQSSAQDVSAWEVVEVAGGLCGDIDESAHADSARNIKRASLGWFRCMCSPWIGKRQIPSDSTIEETQ
jgi:hypothetical protein